MFILFAIAASVIISCVQIFTLDKEKSPWQRVRVFLADGLVIPVFTVAVQKYILGYKHFIQQEDHGWGDVALIFLLSLAIGAVLLAVRYLIRKHLEFAPRKRSRGITALRIAAVVLFALGALGFFMTNWSKAEYGDLPPDQVLFLHFSPAVGSPAVDFISAFEGPVLNTLLVSIVWSWLVYFNFHFTLKNKEKTILILKDCAQRVISIVAASLICVGGLSYAIYRFHVIPMISAYVNRSAMIADNYVDPRDVHVKFPEKKRNLIHIFLESVEFSYADKAQGGFMDVNMIPELTELAKEGYVFSHTDGPFGGPRSAVGTTWSVASMVNMTTGLPMKTPNKPNAYGTPGDFLPGACALGDLMAKEGYEQTLMFGADSDFGGLTYYFQTHGNYNIKDYKYARETGMIPPDYLVWWGYEDDKLFEFAKDEITRMYKTGRPFNFIMETADTHRPDGYLSPNAPTPHENQYANVVSYSSAETLKFVRWIQAQPFYDNTTIVITGDHLSMETNFFEFYHFDEDYRRSQYNLILNPAPGVDTSNKNLFVNRDYANFDFFPTIMTALGIQYDGHRLGIGTDLFSGEKTLFEEFGFSYINKEMEKTSLFFNDNILRDPRKSGGR